MSAANEKARHRLDSDLLRTFLAVATQGSVTRGALQVFRTQSAVTLQLQRLERSIGEQIFLRSGRGIALTPTGQKLWEVARRVVGELDQAYEELRNEELSGRLRIGVPDEFGHDQLPRLLATFSESHPKVDLEVLCASGVDFASRVAKGELDLAIHAPEKVSPLDVSLGRERAVWVGTRHPTLKPHDILRLALFDKTCWWTDRTLHLLERGARKFRVVYTSESVAGVKAAIVAGMAVGVLPEAAIDERVRPLGREWKLPSLGSCSIVITTGGRAQNPSVLAMRAAIVSAFRK